MEDRPPMLPRPESDIDTIDFSVVFSSVVAEPNRVLSFATVTLSGRNASAKNATAGGTAERVQTLLYSGKVFNPTGNRILIEKRSLPPLLPVWFRSVFVLPCFLC